jgi:hypothetical protein
MRAAIIILALVAVPRRAAAQLCHLGSLDADSEQDGASAHAHHVDAGSPHHVEATLRADVAALDGGSYQGLVPAVGWHRARLGAYVALPVYRLDRDSGSVSRGPGDGLLQGHARLLGGRRWRVGAVAAVTVPTGDADQGLGTGHVMAMPGLWGAVRVRRSTTLVTAVLGKAIGDDDGGHHHVHGLHVSPMNAFEIGATARSAVALDIHAIALVASPIGDGVFRAAAGGGASLRIGRWDLEGEGQVGLAGDPFLVRASLSLRHTF